MKGKYGGPMPVNEFYQALYEDKAGFFERLGITHVRAAYLYFTPCDESGEPVTIRDKSGRPMDGYVGAGGYRSAADAYDRASAAPLEARPLFRPPNL
ncbi:MAG: hypothetical protein Q8P46_03335 [Hyphomicrobiales bacterium]|nr:hypothetical protein [Hyphomicrobiales bacterium]